MANDMMKQMGLPEFIIDAEVIEVQPPHKPVQTCRFLFNDAHKAEGFRYHLGGGAYGEWVLPRHGHTRHRRRTRDVGCHTQQVRFEGRWRVELDSQRSAITTRLARRWTLENGLPNCRGPCCERLEGGGSPTWGLDTPFCVPALALGICRDS